MFEFVRTHTKLLQLLLLILILPSFVVFGIQGYSSFSEDRAQVVAKVDGQDIGHAGNAFHDAAMSVVCSPRSIAPSSVRIVALMRSPGRR